MPLYKVNDAARRSTRALAGMDNSWLRQLLDDRTPVSFKTTCTVEEAVRRLSTITVTSRWRTIFSQCIYGKVSPRSVRLERTVPFFTNSWKPVFEGYFEESHQATILVGTFGVSTYTRRFMKVFVSFGVAWSIFACLSLWLNPTPELPWWFPLAGIGMAALGILMNRTFAKLSGGDVTWLSDRIKSSLR